MFFSSWRRRRNSPPGRFQGERAPGARHPSYRPQLDPLEDRVLLASLPGATLVPSPVRPLSPVVPPASHGAALTAPLGGLRPVGATPPGGGNQMRVTVDEGARDTVIDLGPVFDTISSIHHENGLRLSMLGNTNSGLVTTDLSEAALTLSYARGACGTATITVGATDVDGVSARETIVVTVRPRLPAVPTSVAHVISGPQAP